MKFKACLFIALLPLFTQGHGIVTNTDQQSFEGVLSGGGHVQIATSSPIVLTQSIHIAADTTIEGISNHAIISGGGNSRLFTIADGITVTFKKVDLVQGKTDGVGGAIFATNVDLALENVLLEANEAQGGAAIYMVGGEARISNSRFSNNRASVEGGAIFASNSILSVNSSMLHRNTAPVGAALKLSGLAEGMFWNTHVLTNISSPSFQGPPGGAVALGQQTSVTFTDCSFLGNGNSAVAGSGISDFQRCSFEGNFSAGAETVAERGPGIPLHGEAGFGGAIYNSGNLIINNCSFYGNAATAGSYTSAGGAPPYPSFEIIPPHTTPAYGPAYGGAIYTANGISQVFRSTFAANTLSSTLESPRGYAIFAESGELRVEESVFEPSNTIETNSAILFEVGNVRNEDPKLGQLGYYGGYTRTIPLLEGSPAIDLGGVAETNSLDQRYAVRAAGTRVDAGSFEFAPSSLQEIPLHQVTVQTRTAENLTSSFVTNVPSGFLLLLHPLKQLQDLVEWEGGDFPQRHPLHLVVTQDLVITAVYNQTYIAITTSVNPENPLLGDVSISTNNALPGQQVTITAVPAPNSVFLGWSGSASGTNNPLVLSVSNDDVHLVAHFSPVYNVNVAISGQGTATVTPSSSDLLPGQTITLQATPGKGMRFAGWTGDLTNSLNPLTLEIHTNLNLTAVFELIPDPLVTYSFNGLWGVKYNYDAGELGNYLQWGWSEALPLVADFDGDGTLDPTVYDPATGIWYIKYSSGGSTSVQFGWTGATPVPADYNGDGRTDIAAYDQTTGIWYFRESGADSDRAVQWGWSEAAPYTGDFDGDGKSDVAVYHAALGDWYIQFTSGGSTSARWGWSTAIPVLGDYDGNGSTDLAVYDPATGTWYIRHSGPKNDFSSGHSYSIKWGWPQVKPAPRDYDGDGKTDIAVYEQSTGDWYIRKSNGPETRVRFGGPNSQALP